MGAMPVDPASLDRVALALGEKVRTLRERRAWTQEELAERAGISRNQVQNIEHSRNNRRDPKTGKPGRGNPRLETIFHLADALDVEVVVLINPDVQLPPAERLR